MEILNETRSSSIKKFDVICNLATQAVVQYSIESPQVYIHSNIHLYKNFYA